MSMVIQRVFNKYQAKGQVGQVSRPEQPFTLESNNVVAGVELKSGYGVYRDNADNKYKLATDAATQALVTGVVHFKPATINTAIVSPTLNNDGEIVIPVNANFELLNEGHIYVVAGGVVRKGDIAVSATDGSGKFIAATANATLTNPMVFEEDGVDGSVVSIKVTGQIALDHV